MSLLLEAVALGIGGNGAGGGVVVVGKRRDVSDCVVGCNIKADWTAAGAAVG